MAKEKKVLTSAQHNDIIFAEIKKHELEIVKLKGDLKPLELAKYATLQECNALAKKKKVK